MHSHFFQPRPKHRAVVCANHSQFFSEKVEIILGCFYFMVAFDYLYNCGKSISTVALKDEALRKRRIRKIESLQGKSCHTGLL